jgi:hypothetical protein
MPLNQQQRLHDKKKLYGRINVLKRLAKYTDTNTRRTIANAIFNGTITYLMPLWGTTEETIIKKLQIAQLRAAKIIIGHPCFRMSTSQILGRVKWMSVAQMCIEKSAILMHDIIKLKQPKIMGQMYKTIKRDQRTRKEPCIERIDGYKPKSDFATKQFFCSALKYYNMIPAEIRMLDKLHFKKEIRVHIKENIPVKGQQFLQQHE